MKMMVLLGMRNDVGMMVLAVKDIGVVFPEGN